LKILLSMERDCLGFDFTIFYVDFVSTEDNGDVFTDPDKVAYVSAVENDAYDASSGRFYR
jgi:hypothetical protein